MAIIAIGIDLAKNVFAVHGVDAAGKAVLVRPAVRRDALLELIAKLPPCLIGMEACSGAREDAQGRLSIHRVRQGFIEQRTATINRIRGLLSEYGHVLPQRAEVVRREAGRCQEDLPGWANTAIGDLLSKLHRLDERMAWAMLSKGEAFRPMT